MRNIYRAHKKAKDDIVDNYGDGGEQQRQRYSSSSALKLKSRSNYNFQSSKQHILFNEHGSNDRLNNQHQHHHQNHHQYCVDINSSDGNDFDTNSYSQFNTSQQSASYNNNNNSNQRSSFETFDEEFKALKLSDRGDTNSVASTAMSQKYRNLISKSTPSIQNISTNSNNWIYDLSDSADQRSTFEQDHFSSYHQSRNQLGGSGSSEASNRCSSKKPPPSRLSTCQQDRSRSGINLYAKKSLTAEMASTASTATSMSTEQTSTDHICRMNRIKFIAPNTEELLKPTIRGVPFLSSSSNSGQALRHSKRSNNQSIECIQRENLASKSNAHLWKLTSSDIDTQVLENYKIHPETAFFNDDNNSLSLSKSTGKIIIREKQHPTYPHDSSRLTPSSKGSSTLSTNNIFKGM